MTTNRNSMFVGMFFGGVIGWVVGEILADHFAPEYYTEEEILKNADLVAKYQSEYGPLHWEHINNVKVRVGVAESEDKEKQPQVDYTKMYPGKDEKPTVQDLVNKYNNPEYEDYEDSEDEDIVEDEFPVIEDGVNKEMWLEQDDVVFTDDMTKDEFLQAVRNPDADIYLLTQEEFLENSSGLKRTKLNYYREDDVLTDDKNRPLDSIERVVGDALLYFGEFTDDPSTIWVRNAVLGGEYEVIAHDISYAKMMLGLPEDEEETSVVEVKNAFEERDRQKEDGTYPDL